MCIRDSINAEYGEFRPWNMSSDEDPSSRGTRTRAPAYIPNGVDRRKYFAERIKAIRSRVETFARCTGENILVIAVDEDGRAHHWGTSAFQKFVADERVTGIMYRYLKEPQPMVGGPSSAARGPKITDATQLAHLRALVQSKLGAAGGSIALGKIPVQWPPSVPFRQPAELNGDQLIAVARSFMETESAGRQSSLLAHAARDIGPAIPTPPELDQPHGPWVPAIPTEELAGSGEGGTKRSAGEEAQAEAEMGDGSQEAAQGPLKKRSRTAKDAGNKSASWETEPLRGDEQLEDSNLGEGDIAVHF
eukprot:TRINITY_DN28810_c0_g3_i1.p1 TRINITY_DN28810_c0_g3~~TRINITY_DN28810_c0_g3_i1.p1  ORF type:complete len:305 (+),score=72.17 TRINITY_DN28810_c0_g3_i1:77-991(+)